MYDENRCSYHLILVLHQELDTLNGGGRSFRNGLEANKNA